MEGYLINEGLLSTYVGKCAAQGGHREVTAPCAYEGVRHFHGSRKFMTDSGPDADNSEVQKFCESRGIKLHVPAYSPWTSGFVRG